METCRICKWKEGEAETFGTAEEKEEDNYRAGEVGEKEDVMEKRVRGNVQDT